MLPPMPHSMSFLILKNNTGVIHFEGYFAFNLFQVAVTILNYSLLVLKCITILKILTAGKSYTSSIRYKITHWFHFNQVTLNS